MDCLFFEGLFLLCLGVQEWKNTHYEFVHLICTLYPESYGIDWNGPVPLNIEHEQVIVDDPPVLLSATQKAALDQQLHTSMIPGSECSIEQSLINHFMVAKLFVHSLHPQ